MKRAYAKLGGQLGLGCVGLGLLLIGLAWNGAAGVDFVSGQIPYLLSGGFLGLSLVVLGVGLFVVDSGRRNRSMLEAELRDLNTSISRLAAALAGGSGTNGHAPVTADQPSAAGAAATAGADAGETVLLGRSSYHRPDCRLAE